MSADCHSRRNEIVPSLLARERNPARLIHLDEEPGGRKNETKNRGLRDFDTRAIAQRGRSERVSAAGISGKTNHPRRYAGAWIAAGRRRSGAGRAHAVFIR